MVSRVSPKLPFPGEAPCPICKQMHDRCAQHKNRTDPPKPCGRRPRPGEKFCRFHGGDLPLVRQKAQRAAQERAAREMARTLGAPVNVDPHTAILREIRWAAGHVEFYRAQVQKLMPEALVQGVRSVTQVTRVGAMAGTETTREAGPDVHVWLKLYGEERDRLRRLCVDAIRIGIDERRVKIEEQQAAMLATGLAWLQNEVTLRLDLDAVESQTFATVLGEMLARLDKLESRVDAP